MDQREYKVPENWERQKTTMRMWTTVFVDENDSSSSTTSDNTQLTTTRIKPIEIEEINVETVRGCWEIPISNVEGILLMILEEIFF